MHDSVLETQKADMLVRDWTHASEAYGMSMKCAREWCIDEKGVPVTDPKKKKTMLEAREKGGAGVGAGTGAVADVVNISGPASRIFEFYW